MSRTFRGGKTYGVFWCSRRRQWPPPAAAEAAARTAQAPGAGPQLTLELFFALSIALIYGTFENIHGTAANRGPRGRVRRAAREPCGKTQLQDSQLSTNWENSAPSL